MAYATAGAAFAGIDANICRPALGLCASESHDRTGWVAGVGLEYAVVAGISVKFEYLHADFGSARYFSTPTTLVFPVATRDVELKVDQFRVGMDWRFTTLP